MHNFGRTVERCEMSAGDKNEFRAQQIGQRSCDGVDRKDRILRAPNRPGPVHHSRAAPC